MAPTICRAVVRGPPSAPAVHTWEDVFNRLRERKIGSVRASTLRGIDSTWRQHVQPVLGARDVTATTREDVIDLIAGREGSAALKVRKLTREIGALAVSLGWLSASAAGPGNRYRTADDREACQQRPAPCDAARDDRRVATQPDRRPGRRRDPHAGTHGRTRR